MDDESDESESDDSLEFGSTQGFIIFKKTNPNARRPRQKNYVGLVVDEKPVSGGTEPKFLVNLYFRKSSKDYKFFKSPVHVEICEDDIRTWLPDNTPNDSNEFVQFPFDFKPLKISVSSY